MINLVKYCLEVTDKSLWNLKAKSSVTYYESFTPRIIAELSTTSQGRKKVPLSSLIETYCDSGQYDGGATDEEDETKAKILSFDKGIKDKTENSDSEKDDEKVNEEQISEEKEVFYCSSRVSVVLEELSRKCKAMDKNILGNKRIPKKKLESNVIAIEDILDQKKKFEKSYGLMKSKEVLDLYQSTARSNITKASEKSSNEDDFSDGERGVLVNKKQA